MGFLYAVPHNQTMFDAMDWFENIRLMDDEKYRNELNYEISRRIFDEKSSFIKYFSDRFRVEGTGGIWKEDETLNDFFKQSQEIK
ncbi:MAG: hypothetical protein K0S76_1262 [Herbinix sp.]|jgi:hypothetical protein|nr:hypothetical protein [Herbinix sp.]